MSLDNALTKILVEEYTEDMGTIFNNESWNKNNSDEMYILLRDIVDRSLIRSMDVIVDSLNKKDEEGDNYLMLVLKEDAIESLINFFQDFRIQWDIADDQEEFPLDGNWLNKKIRELYEELLVIRQRKDQVDLNSLDVERL